MVEKKFIFDDIHVDTSGRSRQLVSHQLAEAVPLRLSHTAGSGDGDGRSFVLFGQLHERRHCSVSGCAAQFESHQWPVVWSTRLLQVAPRFAIRSAASVSL